MPIIMFGAVRWWKSRREEKRTKPGKKADVDEEEDKPVRIIANVISPAPMRQGDKDGGGDAGPASTPPKIDTSPE